MMQRACLALILLCSLRCAAQKDGAADAGGDAARATAQGIALSGIVFEAAMNSVLRGPRVDGVEVCQDSPRRCVKTDFKGQFTLDGLMPESESLLVFRKEGFAPLLEPLVTPRWSSIFGIIRFRRLADLQAEAPALKTIPPDAGLPAWGLWPNSPGRASIIFGSFGADTGITSELRVALDPSSGEGPFFVLAGGDTVRDVPAGQSAMYGFYSDVEPRDAGYELVYEHAHGDCKYFPSGLSGWPSASGRPNATRVPARGDYQTGFTSVPCRATNDP